MSSQVFYNDENSVPNAIDGRTLKKTDLKTNSRQGDLKKTSTTNSTKGLSKPGTRRVLGALNPTSKNANRPVTKNNGEIDNSKSSEVKKQKRTNITATTNESTPQVQNRFSQLTLSPKVDEKDKEDPQCVVEYVKDIYEYYKQTEKKYAPNPGYMKKQTDLTSKMRAVLIDWLITVHHQFRLKLETIYLTVNIIDRFLSLKLISRNKLQLVGVTAMMLASKYEDIFSPEVYDFVWVTDKSYTKSEILRMERVMLAALDFNLTVPTVFPFIKRFLKVSSSDSRTEFLTQFFAETALLDTRMLKCLPSKIAAVSVYLARAHSLPTDQVWCHELEHYSGYTLDDIQPVAKAFYSFVKNVERSKLQAVTNKYTSEKRKAVARLVSEKDLAF
eukprot:gb/GECH01012237.1/.p1 GENE.gb/GECH01012237.1/~~gb/GECH01012237.1/.p1  ORF type:complete len:387 (+),score=77.43 gb/GECH01012237.1/:1-1161(+)